MQQYNVTGMSCAACSARVEKAVSGVEGVSVCNVNLLTNSMGVEGSASPEAIIKAVENAGYGASLKNDETQLADTETPKLAKRLAVSLAFLLPLMYISMGHMMWNFPVPHIMHENAVIYGAAQLVLAAAVIAVNRKFFINGFKGVIHKAPNMDTLVALGSGVSFLYSTVILIITTMGIDAAKIIHAPDNLYFESAAMILTLITVGKLLESYSKGRTTSALKGLISLVPETAVVLKDGAETVIPASELKAGDIFIVRSGERIPVDGTVLEGSAAVDEAVLTGESIPVDKGEGDTVRAATVSSSGYIKCRAEKVGSDTTLARIIKLVSETAATKAPAQKLADKVSGVFVPTVIIIALITFVFTLIFGHEFGYALSRGITVLVISCPCALGLATPVAIMAAGGKGAKNGILFKTAASLEEAGKIQIVALDKTGTVTKGEPQLTDIIPVDTDEKTLLSLAYSLEIKSEHPLANAVVRYAEENSAVLLESEGFKVSAGNGVSAVIDGCEITGGNMRFIGNLCEIESKYAEMAYALSDEGKTPLMFTRGGKLIGIIAVADVIKEDSSRAVTELRNMGIRVIMLTGDNERTANAIGRQAGVDAVISDVLPDGKEEVIRGLMQQGKVAMVGDGINDAPALTRADIGFAVHTGTDIAADAADIVLMNSRLTDVPAAIRLSRATLLNIRENLFWAFIYNIIGIPLAAGAFAFAGLTLTPEFGAAAMSLSSFCVVTNALRLNMLNIRSPKRDKKIKTAELVLPETEIKEKNTMTKTMKIEGMMCPHCEKAVKTALESLDGVSEAVPSHVDKNAVLTLTKDVDDALLIKTVESLDYKVLGIE